VLPPIPFDRWRHLSRFKIIINLIISKHSKLTFLKTVPAVAWTQVTHFQQNYSKYSDASRLWAKEFIDISNFKTITDQQLYFLIIISINGMNLVHFLVQSGIAQWLARWHYWVLSMPGVANVSNASSAREHWTLRLNGNSPSSLEIGSKEGYKLRGKNPELIFEICVELCPDWAPFVLNLKKYFLPRPGIEPGFFLFQSVTMWHSTTELISLAIIVS
jgi:hypothetical protein